MKNSKPKKSKSPKEEVPNEWDLSQGMGIFPEDVSFTQNIGCVGGKGKPKDEKPANNKE
ncbi:hypothetical protein [Algoriphagus machipongonensis]|uniref:Uncharacterized protein n=1 Tax=Algoriphagus machipongonensis TaxID=388413 RepID=A3HTW5_9BACT|nr:hypothetical protein [Algoriphagus machipongonensis]EAZ81587.1 hypothetical protein ALPR1_00060 [Algoriphagus machipongonensis]